MKGPRCRPLVNPDHWTKRSVLSMVASLFDPLGWMAPVLIQARILLQDVWLAGLDWDDPIPSELAARWSAFMDEVDSLTGMVVPRWVGFTSVGAVVEVHGFADASERAYSAAVYLRVVHPLQSARLSLLAAKTKVAPTKLQSIPRLELCGALLLARLQSTLQNSLSLGRVKVYSWTDASVALAWIRAHPSKWKPFVAHRVAEIQRLLPDTTWRHISTTDNPADLATRGISSSELRASSLWWNGPIWLSDTRMEWPSPPTSLDLGPIPDQRTGTLVAVHQVEPRNEYISHFSKWSRLVRVTAYILRFIRNTREPAGRTMGLPLSAREHCRAEITIFRLSQLEGYPLEIEALMRGKPLRASSPLISLTPFIDSDGVMRVGGRIQDAPVPYAQRHPIILSRHTHVAQLIIEAAHLRTLHGGVDLTRTSLLQRFWIPRSRPLVKKLLRRCLRCTRFKAATAQQQMGNLPGVRLQPSKPFEHAGVDYAGPFQIRTSRGRGQKAYKGYMVVFVCLCTKAVHLDAVTDLTSTTFIAAFQRFISRRGRCAQLWSDNATTFRGADAELRRMFQGPSEFRRTASQELAAKGTEWRFIPPYAPHFGGLWEAAVKSAKYHIKRTIGDQRLTYEELSTLLCQVEACLNSRPLMPIAEDPKDLLPLTPGHFLIGEPVTSLETSSDVDFDVTGLKRWRLVNNLRNHFWRRWQQEYLHLLQQRPKWRTRVENLKEGSLVLIRNELSPPTKWPLARVLKMHPGPDGLARVATLQTATKTCTRPLTRIIPLPVEATHAESNDASQ